MLSTLWGWTRGHRGRYLLGLVALLATNALAMTLPLLLGRGIDALRAGVLPRRLALLAGGMIAIALLQAAIRTVSRLMILGNSRRITCEIRDRLFAHLLTLDAPYYDSRSTGDLMSRVVNDLRQLRSFYGPAVMNVLNTTIAYAAALTLLISIDPGLTVVALLPFPLVLIVAQRLSRRIYQRSRAVQEQLAALSEQARENFAGIAQVKTYAQEKREIAAFEAASAEYRLRCLSVASLRGAMISSVGAVAGIGTLIVLAQGGAHVIEGRLTLGEFVAFNSYLGMLAWPTIALGWIINVFQRGAAATERLLEVFRAQPTIALPPRPAAGIAAPLPLRGEIRIVGLDFRYGDREGHHPLRIDTLQIEAGSRLAIVGPVGAGKSTLANLLCRVYPVPAGRIFLDGEDLADIDPRRLRASIGYVPQDGFLFSRSLRDNLLFGRPEASDEELAAAIRLAQLEPDIAMLDDGLETLIGERGVTLSGGQRQRVTLARALLCRPRLLILDDSLSAVDADTEARILTGLATAMEGRTTLFITHRLAAAAGMDRILVIDRGRIVEDGSHQTLLAAGGLYTRLLQHARLSRRLERP
ncbi:MAG TPA: ABC transporter ATP-binding protein [Acidobacteria bacterium]|nr:ABC transporter ATP-binding protein [Acidobacteriota bacterium]